MSILAYVLCVLLVATATTATADVVDAETTTDIIIALTEAAKQRYDSAIKTVNEILSEMKLEKPLEMDSRPSSGKAPSAECYGFLKKCIEAHRALVVECSERDLEKINFERKRLEKWLDPLLRRFYEHKRFADLCVPWYEGLSDGASNTALCIAEVHADITAMDERANEEITEIVRNVRKVANAWVARAGHCVASDEARNAVAEWSKACEGM